MEPPADPLRVLTYHFISPSNPVNPIGADTMNPQSETLVLRCKGKK